MARIFHTSLNGIGTDAQAIQVFGSGVATGAAITASAGRAGGKGIVFTDRRGYYQLPIENRAEVFFRFPLHGSGGEAMICAWMDGATEQVSLWKRADQKLEFRRGATVLLTGDGVISSTALRVISGSVLFHASAGEVDLKVNGIDYMDDTGLDTTQTANAYCSAMRFGEGNATTGTVAFTIGDIAVNDDQGAVNNTTPSSGGRIVQLIPSANGATNNFTPLSSTNVSNIDDTTPDDDTTYNASSTAGHIDLFELPSLSPAASAVAAVSVVTWARKTDSGARVLRNRINDGSNTVESGDFGVSESYEPHVSYHDTAPDTTAWSDADVTALKIGYEVQS
jgi:hypothetical protein